MEPLRFTAEQSLAYRQVLAPEATDVQWTYFITECERRALVPNVHVVFQLRYSNEFDRQLQREVSTAKVTLVTTINALRLIALRSGKYKGHTPFEYHYMDANDALSSSKIPLGRLPHAVSASFHRDGWVEPLFATARFDAYKQSKHSGGLTQMWQTRSEEQLAKCCEAAGLRTVAPEECGGLYLAEEFGDEPIRETVGNSSAPTMLPPAPTVAPAVNSASAVSSPVVTHVEPVEQHQAVSSVSSPVVTHVEPPKSVQQDVKVVAVPPVQPPKPPVAPKPPALKPPVAPKTQTAATAAPTTPDPATTTAPRPKTAAEAQAVMAVAIQQEAEQLTAPEMAALQVAMDNDRVPKNAVAPVTPVAIVVPAQPATLGTPAVPAIVVAPAPVPQTGTDGPATASQYNEIVRGRATKLVRDKLDKVPGAFKPTEAGRMLLAYLLKQSGQTELRKASAATLENIISVLEQATPEEAVKLVKG